jgi:alkylated DNA nucleotide flippase Atl1
VPVFAVSGDYTDAVLDVVARIPPGRVMTYGDVAWTFGRPGARAVGMVMRYHGSSVPWWRVIRAGGLPPAGLEAKARTHYEEEGTPLLPSAGPAGYRIDLARAAWSPTP